MRRPLKPFVTEYKASNRRNSGGPAEQGVFESERPNPKPFDFAFKPDSDDSYDAAMRAADALFSIPAAEPMVVAHAEPPSGEMPLAPSMAPPSIAPPSIATPPEKGSSRILRVLDEEPSPEYAALEIERTPKRRGRKPGSKNKPKVALSSDHALANLVSVPQAAMQAVRVPKIQAPLAAVAPVSKPAARKIPALAAGAMPPVPNGAAPRGDTRFPWVRDRLKPGEDWKRRRLPRICW